MTLSIAWLAQRPDGREDLYFASDSRTRGGSVLDTTPKILTLPRSDCAIAFAGDTASTYPLMLHISAAIEGHSPARDRNLDISELKGHLLHLCSDILANTAERHDELKPSDVQFIFGGYSWRAKKFRLWTFYYEPSSKKMRARRSQNFHPKIQLFASIGDWGARFRRSIHAALRGDFHDTQFINKEPLLILSKTICEAGVDDTIGGAPQLVRVSQHMTTRPFCVEWGDDSERHVFGRKLYDYENCDYWTVNPWSGAISAPRHFNLTKQSRSD